MSPIPQSVQLAEASLLFFQSNNSVSHDLHSVDRFRRSDVLGAPIVDRFVILMVNFFASYEDLHLESRMPHSVKEGSE